MEIQKKRLSRFCMSLSAMAMLSVFSTAQADSSTLASATQFPASFFCG